MQGHDVTQIPCGHCPRKVNDIDAVWCEGIAYHEQCYHLSLSNEIRLYQKKVTLGTITLAESNRMSELQTQLNLLRDSDKRPAIFKKFKRIDRKLPSIVRSGCPVFFSEERRQARIDEQKRIKEVDLLVAAKIKEDKLLCESFGVEYNFKNIAEIEGNFLLTEKNNNTSISTAEISEKTT